MKKLFAFFIVIFSVFSFGSELLTKAEKTDYKETSTYKDVMDFLWKAQKMSKRIKVKFIGKSEEGKKIPLVIVSDKEIVTPKEAHLYGKEVVYIEANIHAGEVEGKEASLMLIRDFAKGKHTELLKNQVILFCPIFNPDGNDKLGKHRYSDNGPELAGVRYNGQRLDLNRDFVKQESPEVRALVKTLNEWDPVLFVDMHTTDGSFHKHTITWMPQMAPWTDHSIMEYSWKKLFPEINRYMKEMGYLPIPYGNFKNRIKPQEGWQYWAVLSRYGVNYVGLRNRFSILDENYARKDFKTRVIGAYSFLKAILKFTNENAKEMRKITEKADLFSKEKFYLQEFPIEFENKKIYEFSLKSFEFKVKKIKKSELKNYPKWFGGYIVEKKDKEKTYKMTLYAPLKPKSSIKLPKAYILLPCAKKVVKKLIENGIEVYKILEPSEIEVEEFKIKSIESSKIPFQGHHTKKVSGEYKKVKKIIPKGSYLIPLEQPLSRLAAVMLEPLSPDGFLYWGLFDEVLFHEWGGKPWMVPVLRVQKDFSNLKLELLN